MAALVRCPIVGCLYSSWCPERVHRRGYFRLPRDVYTNLLQTSCAVLENNMGMDCSGCDCELTVSNHSTMANPECTPDSVLYISLVANGLLAILTFVSELMGSNDKISVNGVLHALLVAGGRRQPSKPKEIEMKDTSDQNSNASL